MHEPATTALAATLAILFVGTIYLLPVIVAYNRGVEKKTAIWWLNILFGGTCVGWFAALLLACTRQTYADRIETERRIAERVAAMRDGERYTRAVVPMGVSRRESSPLVRGVFAFVILVGLLALVVSMAPEADQPSAEKANLPSAVTTNPAPNSSSRRLP